MNAISLWLLTYVLPALLTGGILRMRSRADSAANAIILHAGLCCSIVVSQYALHSLEFSFPWQPHPLSLIMLAGSIVFAVQEFGLFGLWYGISAILQQLTILSVAFLLLQFLPLTVVLLLVVPVFAAGHAWEFRGRRLKIILVSLWGVVSIMLFALQPDVYFLSAAHTLLGTVGIRRSILYVG